MKFFKKAMIIFLLIIIGLTISTFIIVNQKKFGKIPSGKRLERIQQSPHYQDGKFVNQMPTPQLSEDTSMLKVLFRFLFEKTENKIPKHAFQFQKTDLNTIPSSQNVFVWMGHSSYYLQIDGKKMLVDPVFSGNAGPFSFATKAFKGTDIYNTEDIPELDYLIITHDHWDHLDYETVLKLFPKTKKIITGLGTAEHLEYWGYDPRNIIELEWEESADLGNGFLVTAETTRHFSGRGFKSNQAMWASFVFETPNQQIYIGGDSGYGDHFKKIGAKYGSFDLAILENGQYNKDWKYIHFLSGENNKAMEDLNAKRMIPVHNSKFALASHSWNEPLDKIMDNNTHNQRIIIPKIGENINWMDDSKVYEKWWKKYE